MGSPERRERERKEMRQLICRAAMKLFLAEGFHRVSMRAIAEQIEYTPGALYSYFKDKDEILHALHEQGFQMLQERLAVVARSLSPFERLRQMGRVYLRFALDNPEYYDLMFVSDATIDRALEREGEDWRPGREAYDLLRQQVVVCQETGSLPPHDLEAATFALWAMVHGIASLVIKRRLVMTPPEQVEAMIESAYEFGLKGMGTGRP